MAKNSMNPNLNVRGMNIYKDKSGRTIYYDRLTKSGYLIFPKNAKLYTFYSKRFIIPIIAFVLLYNFNIGGHVINASEAGIIALVTLMIMEVLFRTHFLKSLTMISNFQPPAREDIITRMTKDTSKGMLIIKAVLYISLAVLLILLAYTEQYGNIEWIFCGILSAGAAVVGILYFIASSKK